MNSIDVLTFEEIRKKIESHLKTAMKIEDFDITYAKIQGEDWHINVEWKKAEELFSSTIALSLDKKTGELTSIAKDKVWNW